MHEHEALKSVPNDQHQLAHGLVGMGVPWEKIHKLLPLIVQIVELIAQAGGGGATDPAAHPHGQKPSP
jgi:hypothetical protein